MSLADAFGYRAIFARLGLSGQVDYTDRNLIERWFHTLKMRVERFHNSWVDSRMSAASALQYSLITIIFSDCINRSTVERQLRRLTIQCRTTFSVSHHVNSRINSSKH